MRTRLAALLLVLVVAGCSAADPSKPAKGEYLLTDTYSAMRQAYPLTQPIFLACDYFRLVGDEQHRPLGELLLLAKDKTDWAALGQIDEQAQRYCS